MSKMHVLTEAVDGLLSNVWSVVVVDTHGEKINGLRFNMDIDHLASAKGYTVFQLNGLVLTKAALVERVEQVAKGLLHKESLRDASSYQVLCDYLSQLRTVAIIIHQSESLSSDVLSTLSRLNSYSKRNGFKLKLLLVGDTEKFSKLFTAGIVVDKSYSPNNKKSSTYTISDKKEVRYKQFGGQAFGLVGAFMLAVVPTAYFLFGNNGQQQHSEPLLVQVNDSVQIKSVDIVKENLRSSDIVASVKVEEHNLVTKEPELLGAMKSREKRAMMSDGMLRAIKQNNKKEIRALFKSGEPLNAVNSAGENMLLMAAWLGSESLVSLALEYAVPVNQADDKGRTPLYYTAIEGNFWLSKLLLEAGANASSSSHINKTPLMAAVRNHHRSIVELLLTHSVDVNAQDHSGWSALFYAVWNGDSKATRLLLDHGADISIRNNENYLAYDIALLRGHDELASTLKD